jgi:hypothetical protein
MFTSRSTIRFGLGAVLLGLAALGEVSGGASPASASASASTEAGAPCEVVREGRHCFTFWGELIQVSYTWLGAEGQIGGQLVLGRSTLPPGECDPGQAVETSPVRFLNPGDTIVVFGRTSDWENWSSVFREVNRDGTVVGVRSQFCAVQPVH